MWRETKEGRFGPRARPTCRRVASTWDGVNDDKAGVDPMRHTIEVGEERRRWHHRKERRTPLQWCEARKPTMVDGNSSNSGELSNTKDDTSSGRTKGNRSRRPRGARNEDHKDIYSPDALAHTWRVASGLLGFGLLGYSAEWAMAVQAG